MTQKSFTNRDIRRIYSSIKFYNHQTIDTKQTFTIFAIENRKLVTTNNKQTK